MARYSLATAPWTVPLGWPLRYSHFPAAVIDMRDLDALARILGSFFSFWDAWFAILCPTPQPPPTAAWINPPILTPPSEENAH